MRLRVDTKSPMPVYEQIRSQLAQMIESGQLPVGTQLPTIRQLSVDLGLAKATVNKAYEQLLREELIESRGRHGTVVAERSRRLTRREVDQRMQEAAQTLAELTGRLNLGDEDAHEYLQRALDGSRR